MLQVNSSERRKSTRLAKKEVKHYDEPVISDDDDYICMSHFKTITASLYVTGPAKINHVSA